MPFMCFPLGWVTWSLAQRPSTPLPDPGDAHGVLVNLDALPRITLPVTDILKPSEEIKKTTYLRHFHSSEPVHRCFCDRYGTNVSYTYYPAPTMNTMDLLLGTLDHEFLVTHGIQPERHVFCDYGIDWVKRLVMEGDTSLFEDGKPIPRQRQLETYRIGP